MNDSSMEKTLKNVAKLLGFLLLAISIYLSYDGFDQGVTGGNGGYTTLAKLIGIVIAVTMACIQFVFGSRFNQLNTTLKLVGLASYCYSIWTNYLGAKHLLGMEDSIAWATAIFMDVVPEPMIAWSLGDSLKGDALGNLAKWFSGVGSKPETQMQQSQPKHQEQPRHNNERNDGQRGRGSERRADLEMQFHKVGDKAHRREEPDGHRTRPRFE